MRGRRPTSAGGDRPPTRPSGYRLRVSLLALGLVGACGRKASTTMANPTATTKAAASASASANPTPSAPALDPKRTCECMMVRGAASVRANSSDAPTPLAQGDHIPNGSVVELPEGADLTIKTASLREITLVGPATASVCTDGEDDVLLSRGKVSAFPGTGVKPGSDVWVATPLGVVRYADAKIDIDASGAGGTRLSVVASMAPAELMVAPGIQLRRGDANEPSPTTPFAEVPIAAGVTITAERKAVPASRLLPQLVRTCTQESEGAQEAVRRLAEGADAGDLGERAAAHVRARRRARAACETARAAAGLGPGVLVGSLLAELTAADEKRNQLTPLPARR